MKQQCMYHPTRTAHWHCPKCNQDFCPECVEKRPKAGYSKNEFMHFCPKCNVETTWVGITNIIDPFWLRLPKIFAYPFSAGPLIFITIVTFLSLIFSVTGGLVGGLISFAIWGVMLKYSFAALKQTASGNLRPPAISSKALSEDFEEVFKQYLIYFSIGVATSFTFIKFGFLIGIAFSILMLISLPAMIILLVSTRQFFAAINPGMFIPLMLRIGWGYLIMCIFLLLLLSAPSAALHFIFPLLPERLAEFFAVFAQNFYTLIMYHLMGYVVLQYHDKIGYQVEYQEFDDPSDKIEAVHVNDPEELLLKDITIMVQEGNLEQAINEIQKYQQNSGLIKNKSLADRYFELLKMTKNTDEMILFAGTYLDLLVEENDKTKGIKVYSHCKSISPDFEPSSSALMKIAGWVGDNGKPESSIKLLNQIIKKYPSDPVTPKAYFRAAQIFHDRMMKPEKARQIINALINKYPDSDVIPMAKRYMEGI